jgi:hypothetical protein
MIQIAGFQQQTLIDAVDGYSFQAERKGGWIVLDPRGITVCVT